MMEGTGHGCTSWGVILARTTRTGEAVRQVVARVVKVVQLRHEHLPGLHDRRLGLLRLRRRLCRRVARRAQLLQLPPQRVVGLSVAKRSGGSASGGTSRIHSLLTVAVAHMSDAACRVAWSCQPRTQGCHASEQSNWTAHCRKPTETERRTSSAASFSVRCSSSCCTKSSLADRSRAAAICSRAWCTLISSIAACAGAPRSAQ